MEVFEKSTTVDPEVRAYIYSLVSAVRQLQADWRVMSTNRIFRSAAVVHLTMVAMFSVTMHWHV